MKLFKNLIGIIICIIVVLIRVFWKPIGLAYALKFSDDEFMEVTNPMIKENLQKMLNNQINAEKKGSFHNLPPYPMTRAPHTGKLKKVEFEGD